MPVVEAVDHVNLVPRAQELEAGVAADVPGAASDQDPHESTPGAKSIANPSLAWPAQKTKSIEVTPMQTRASSVLKNWRVGQVI